MERSPGLPFDSAAVLRCRYLGRCEQYFVQLAEAAVALLKRGAGAGESAAAAQLRSSSDASDQLAVGDKCATDRV